MIDIVTNNVKQIGTPASRLEGIQCGFKKTSCPDQLAQALKEATGK